MLHLEITLKVELKELVQLVTSPISLLKMSNLSMVSNTTCLVLVNCVIKGFKVIFECLNCHVIDVKTNKIIFSGHRQGNIYVVYLNDLSSSYVCLMAK